MKNLLTKITLFIFLLSSFNIINAQKTLTINTGHYSGIQTVAYSHDGKYIISGSDDNNIKVWDAKTGREIRTLEGHKEYVNCVAFSPDGKYIASGANENIFKLWDPLTGKQIGRFCGHSSYVKSIAFSPDGKYLVSGSWDKVVYLWEVEGQKYLKSFNGHSKYINGVAFSHDGRFIVSGGDDQKLIIWDVESGKAIKTFKGQSAVCVAFSPYGEYVACGGWGKKVEIWNIDTGLKTETAIGHTSYVKTIAFSPDNKYIVSSDGLKINLWDIRTGKKIRTFSGHTKGVNCVCFNPEGNKIISAGGDRTIRIWEVQNGLNIQSLMGNTGATGTIMSPDEKYIASGGRDFNIKLWSTQNKQHNKIFKGHTDKITNVVFSSDSKYILSGSWDKKIKLWDVKTKKNIKTFTGHTGIVYCATFSPDGKHIASGSLDKTIKIWDIKSGKIIKTFTDIKRIKQLIYSPDGKFLLSRGDYHYYKVWNIESGKTINEIESLRLNTVAFSNDGRYIASAITDIGDWGTAYHNFKFLDTETGKEIKSFKGHKEDVTCLAFSKDNKHIVSGSADRTLKLWDIETGKEISTLAGHTSYLIYVDFFANDKYIISGSTDGSNKIWKTETGELLATIFYKRNTEDYIIITPDGRFDGTQKGIELLHYVDGMEIIPLSSLFEHFYTPNLISRIFAGEKQSEIKVKIDEIKNPPLIKITSPVKKGDLRGTIMHNAKGRLKSTQKKIQIIVEASDQGGGIDEILLYHNGKLLQTTQRGFKPIEKQNDIKTKTFEIELITGENIIKATAFNNERTEAVPDYTTIFYEGQKAGSNLYVFAIGINEYKKPQLHLNYAIADAAAIISQLKKGSKSIFDKTEVLFLKNSEVTKQNIRTQFDKLNQKIKQEDVFVFYYAGHGIMSEETTPEFHIIPFDVTKLYDETQLETKAISAGELKAFSQKIACTKAAIYF
jgi:WD40 repeat protein